LSRGEYPRAARRALKTIGLRYQFPWAHHYLGIALERLKRYREAARAFEVAVEQNPNLLVAHCQLEHLYSHLLGGSTAARAKADEHSRAIGEIGARIEAHRGRRAAEIPRVDAAAGVQAIEPDAPGRGPPRRTRWRSRSPATSSSSPACRAPGPA